jgi:chromosome segregation protein
MVNTVNCKLEALNLKLDSPSAFLAATQQRRERIQELEKNVSILQSSMALDRVTDLERQLDVAREKVTRADTDVSRASTAESFAREVEATLKRVGAEIVDERLSDLSPLLSELYLRLRPHTEWAEIQYLMRGDVRRFLSFNVGPDINPRFVFSSGQRRALGLSFLLAVHLSRKWCNLKTLMLDDPVQHIDDYRAMHLVEVLSSIRSLGWQVICAVEDSALADLLCRRLSIEASGEGVKVEMHFDNGKGISALCSDVVPLAQRALLSA